MGLQAWSQLRRVEKTVKGYVLLLGHMGRTEHAFYCQKTDLEMKPVKSFFLLSSSEAAVDRWCLVPQQALSASAWQTFDLRFFKSQDSSRIFIKARQGGHGWYYNFALVLWHFCYMTYYGEACVSVPTQPRLRRQDCTSTVLSLKVLHGYWTENSSEIGILLCAQKGKQNLRGIDQRTLYRNLAGKAPPLQESPGKELPSTFLRFQLAIFKIFL